MRKNKKLLLGGLSVLTLVAAGSGAVSTFAWFVATQSVTIAADDTPSTGALKVGETSGDSLTLNAEIHFVAGNVMKYNGDPASASALSTGSILLTTWGKTSPSPAVDGSDANNTTLITGYKNNASASISYKALTASDVGWAYVPISAWVEDTSADKSAGDHTAVWRQAIADAANNYTGKVTFDYTNTDDSGALLLNSEVYFYGVNEATPASPSSAPTSFAKASQVVASADGGIEFTVSAKNLTTDHETSGTALLLGYLVVRFEGSVRNHTHGTNYTATIAATSTII